MSADWTTDAERSGYRRSPGYADTIAWLERLARATPDLALASFGTTPEGREMRYAVAARDGDTNLEFAHRSGKAVVLVEGGIHSGEIEGKDAGLALLRDLTVTGRWQELLAHTVLVFIPVFNIDGHERASRWLRINQNGPEERGTRGTAQNINLNRDFVKADAPEMRAWLKLFQQWLPDLFVDIHTTNGADYAYDLTWFLEEWENLHPAPRAWQRDALIGRVFPALQAQGHRLAPYLELVDHRDITKGLANFGSGPRFSTGYTAIRNRPGLLVETHMLKSYESRVHATYDLLIEILRELDARTGELCRAVDVADRETVAQAAAARGSVPLALATTKTPEPFQLDGYAFTQQHSEISGDTWTTYDPSRPLSATVPFFRQLEVAESVTRPAAYLVPPAWAAHVRPALEAHGIAWTELKAPTRVAAERYRLGAPRWADASFEGRVRLEDFTLAQERGEYEVRAGALLVRLDQRAANVAMHLLEPRAPDSLLQWGGFNTIFESREYADARVGEALAREMLREDPSLRAEFDRALEDEAFARNPEARLRWFFDRSPWLDPELGIYPVLRLGRDALAPLAPAPG
ncbi:MAG TPA: M14 family metallopeptidase [Xanthomonadales bacterium]|nr:M14 family metallopeptidase [Xanthomonadales bacterium]